MFHHCMIHTTGARLSASLTLLTEARADEGEAGCVGSLSVNFKLQPTLRLEPAN